MTRQMSSNKVAEGVVNVLGSHGISIAEELYSTYLGNTQISEIRHGIW